MDERQISRDEFKARPLSGSRYEEEEEIARSRAQASLGPRYEPSAETFRSRDQPLSGPRYEEQRLERPSEVGFARGPTSVGPRYAEPLDRENREVMPRNEDQVPTRHRRDLTPEIYAQAEDLRDRMYQQQDPSMLNKVKNIP